MFMYSDYILHLYPNCDNEVSDQHTGDVFCFLCSKRLNFNIHRRCKK